MDDIVAVYDGRVCEGRPKIQGRVDHVFNVIDGVIFLPEHCHPCLFIYALESSEAQER